VPFTLTQADYGEQSDLVIQLTYTETALYTLAENRAEAAVTAVGLNGNAYAYAGVGASFVATQTGTYSATMNGYLSSLLTMTGVKGLDKAGVAFEMRILENQYSVVATYDILTYLVEGGEPAASVSGYYYAPPLAWNAVAGNLYTIEAYVSVVIQGLTIVIPWPVFPFFTGIKCIGAVDSYGDRYMDFDTIFVTPPGSPPPPPPNIAPVAVIRAAERGIANSLILFEATSSYDPDGGPFWPDAYYWETQDAGQTYVQDHSGHFRFTFTQEGWKTVKLRVTDSAGAATWTELSIYISAREPWYGKAIASGDYNPNPPYYHLHMIQTDWGWGYHVSDRDGLGLFTQNDAIGMFENPVVVGPSGKMTIRGYFRMWVELPPEYENDRAIYLYVFDEAMTLMERIPILDNSYVQAEWHLRSFEFTVSKPEGSILYFGIGVWNFLGNHLYASTAEWADVRIGFQKWTPQTISAGKPVTFSYVTTSAGQGGHVDTKGLTGKGYKFMGANDKIFTILNDAGCFYLKGWFKMHDTLPESQQSSNRYVDVYVLDSAGTRVKYTQRILTSANQIDTWYYWEGVVDTSLTKGAAFKIGIGRTDTSTTDYEFEVEWSAVEIQSGFSVNLVAGYNLISLPMITTYKASTLGLDSGDTVSLYDSATQTYKNHIVGVPLNDFDIMPGMGFWVNVGVAKTLTLYGTILTAPTAQQRIPITVPAGGGSAVIGMCSMNTGWHAADLAAMYSGSTVFSVAKWNAATQSYTSYIIGVPVNNFSLVPGEGYFINVNGSGMLTYNP
jgi:hypothetical protein